jgi:hypothetical protein
MEESVVMYIYTKLIDKQYKAPRDRENCMFCTVYFTEKNIWRQCRENLGRILQDWKAGPKVRSSEQKRSRKDKS